MKPRFLRTVGWNAVVAEAAMLQAKQASSLSRPLAKHEREGRRFPYGRTTFQCIITFMHCLTVMGVMSSSVGAKLSSVSRLRSRVFSSGLRNLESSGRGTMKKNATILRSIVESPSIRKTLETNSAYSHEDFERVTDHLQPA